ncbi:hypothetical protein [Ascidiimonas sp. W6]|uniref:hypothetical protein n=1 Tax=Ascidiimonas meishanensis TaxID=3128903 RepID=UPI0030EEE969
MKKLTLLYTTILAIAITSCGGGGDDVQEKPEVTPPSAATLIFPEDNTECNEGTVISDTQSTVTFRWNASDNTDSYTVNVKNLNTNSTTSQNASTNQLDITILRGVPYSWSVVSRANGASQTATSQTWKFYNAGLPVESYIPFPAEAISPTTGADVDASSGAVTLEWEGEDIDDDIQNYDVFFGVDNPPATKVNTVTASSISVDITAGNVYYWSIVTRDQEGNTSNSEVFQFRAN